MIKMKFDHIRNSFRWYTYIIKGKDDSWLSTYSFRIVYKNTIKYLIEKFIFYLFISVTTMY